MQDKNLHGAKVLNKIWNVAVESTGWAKKVQITISMQPFKIIWNGFHQNVPGFWEFLVNYLSFTLPENVSISAANIFATAALNIMQS